MKTKNKIGLIALTITLLLRVQGLAQTITYTNGNPVNTTVSYGGQWTYSVSWVAINFPQLYTVGFFKNSSAYILYNNYPANGSFQYTISGVSSADDGYYYVGYDMASGNYGVMGGWAGNSPTVYLHVSPAVLTQPTNTTCLVGTATSLGIAAGPSTATFQWIDSATGTVIANTASFTATAGMNGERVYCKISNSYGSVSSSSAVLTVGSAPAITTQPVAATTLAVGGSATLNVVATGTATLAYQWYRNGVAMTGANLNYVAFNPAALTDAGTYQCAISNSYGITNTTVSTVKVGIPPAITSQSGSLIVTQGQSASFSVTATGTPLNYYWQKNGVTIAGATNASYTITTTTLASAATYTCLVSNFVGTATSTGAVLTVYYAPIITVQPTNQTISFGSDFTVSVTANGNPALAYQWRTNGTAIPGATVTDYTITRVQTGNAVAYDVVITNMIGSVTSSVANVQVIIPLQGFAGKTASNGLSLQLIGAPNYPYILQSATNLTPPVNWQPVLTNPADGNGNWQFTDTNLNGVQKFYRAVGQ